MGISGILPKILPSAGRENYDLRALADGLIVVVASSFPPSPTTRAANEADTHRNTHGDDDGDDVGHGRGDDNGSVREAKRRKLLPSFSFQSTPSTAQRSTTWKRRKFRVAIDIHGWIARAAHGNGACLLDERHLSYYGRNELGMELEKLRTSHNGSVENCNVGNGDAIPEEQNDHLQKQREQQRLLQEQRQLEFIIKCTNFVLHRLEYLQKHCQVDILPVLDGKTPPCKRETVKLRAGKKEEASFVRDGNGIAARETNIPAAASYAAENETITTDEAAATEAEALRKIAASKRAGATYNPPNETDACDESNEKRPTIQQQFTKELLKEFRRRKYPFLQSPYEADGQLAYLANRRLVDLVITEDSDLIALGVETLVYRLKGGNCDDDGILEANNHHYNTSDTGNGNPFADTNYGNSNTNRNFTTPLKGTILHRKDLGSSHGIDLLDFSNAMLATMFVAAGCDYCDSLIGIGIVTARNAVKRAFHGSAEADGIYRFGGRRFRGGSGGGIDDDDDDDDFDDDNDGGRMPVLKKVLNELFRSCQKIDRGRFLPLHDPAKEEARNSYERSFLRALAMFRHPLVYDPILCRNVISNDVSEGEGDSHNSSNYQGAQGGVRATPSFMRDEEILMEYQPYRELVTNRKLLYGAVGTPFSPDIARKIAEGLLDPRTVQCTNVENHNSNHTTCDNPPQEYDNHDNYDEYAKTSSTKTIEHSSTRLEADETTNAAPFAYFTQDSHSNQPSSSYNSQENFFGGGKGTEQSKSTSSGTSTGLISSLSPDLLASPSPVKYYV